MERDPIRRSLGAMQNPVRGLLHGSAALVFVVGAILLWTHSSGEILNRTALAAFGVSLVALYTVSTLYHSVPWRVRWKQRMQRLDHSMIYVLIAGSYTPLAAIVLEGWLCWATLAAVWGIAVLGIAQKIAAPGLSSRFSATLQAIQGWLALPLLGPLSERLPAAAIELAVLGGLLYTAGLVFFATQRPRLWPGVFSYHEVFHVFVVAGSASHYTMVFAYLLPLA